jgi:hypothetical protein
LTISGKPLSSNQNRLEHQSLVDQIGAPFFTLEIFADITATLNKNLPKCSIFVIIKDLDLSKAVYSTDLPYNMKYIRLYERDTQEFYQFTFSLFKSTFPETSDIDAASFAEKWINKIGQNYVDLNAFLSSNSQNSISLQKKNFQTFVDLKYSNFLSKINFLLQNYETENFLKQILRVMMKNDRGEENGWVDTDDFVMGRGYRKEGVWGLVESGVVDWDDDRVRFRSKVGYGAVLGKYFG